ncbi:MAG: type VI secretion system accessory protein TagJ [Planctomycetota bacterium]
MGAADRLREGDLDACLAELQDEVRNDPSDAKSRVFLFQLLAVLGQWERAATQLEVAGDLDHGTLSMVSAYRHLVASEPFRREVFAGNRSPLIFGDPEEWVALLIESTKLSAAGQLEQAGELRDEAFEAAPTTRGTITAVDGENLTSGPQSFEWIADADTRLGPIIEAMVGDRYYWIPVQRIAHIQFEPPVDLRDMVWAPAYFTWANGGEATGFIPTRYPGSDVGEEHDLKLARRTDWTENAAGCFGLGQRLFATDAGEFPILQIREVTLETGEGGDESGADAGDGEDHG